MSRPASTKPPVASCAVGRLGACLLAACGAVFTARAESIHALSGWVQPAVAPYDQYGQFVILSDPLDRVRAILRDPQGRLTTHLPARLNLRATITQPRGPEDEPVFQIAQAETGSPAADSEAATGTGAPPWLDLNGGLFPPEMNVSPRRLSLTDDDQDGDGVPDERDVFPGVPDEWQDNDRDGIGDNADPDDDNDGMSDNYEVLCALDPLLADAHKDADGDGMSNGDEAVAGTLANDAASLFVLSAEADPKTGKLNLRWPALPTRVYGLEMADSPSGRWFRVLDGWRPTTNAVHTFSLVLAEQPAACFRASADYP